MPTVLLLLTLAQAPAPSPEAARAQKALQPFKATLKGALEQALKDSPVKAIEVCAVQAPALAKAHSTGGAVLGRAAVKRRNPDNAGPAWVAGPLAELARAPSGTPASRVVALPGGKVGYAEAIWVQQPCLTCHGETLAPEVQTALQEKYPKDAATGFKLGDFRGVFWAELEPAGK